MSEISHPTRDALLEAAETLFSERGYTAVGIREIADRANVNIAAIKYHFGSKRDLYFETVRRAINDKESSCAWNVLEDHVPTTAREAGAVLAFFVRCYLRQICAPDAGGEACGLLLSWEAIRPSDAIDDIIAAYIRPGHDSLVNLVNHLLPSSTDPASGCLHARSLLGQILHYHVFREFIQRVDSETGVSPSEASIVEHIVHVCLRSIGRSEAFIKRALEDARDLEVQLPSSTIRQDSIKD